MGGTEGTFFTSSNGPPTGDARSSDSIATSRSRRARAYRNVAGASAAILAAVGGLATGPAWASQDTTARLQRALAAWAHFPVDAPTRPIVLIDGDSVNGPSSGFSDDADKIAYLDGSIVTPTTFPSGPTSADHLPLISAVAAFNMLRGHPATGPTSDRELNVAAIVLGTGLFQTDRGPRRLPAWQFRFQGVQDAAEVLAVSQTALFSPRKVGNTPSMTAAALGSDDRTLTVTFPGAPAGNGPCDASYGIDVAESKTAVAISIHETTPPAPPKRSAATSPSIPVACALPAYPRHLTTTLPRPLGKRVVVDAVNLTAVPVTSVSP
jgi:hypothetical protein